MRMLDLGCLHKKYEAGPDDTVIGVDIQDTPAVDVVHDLEQPLPFEDNSFDMVYIKYTLEHINNRIQLMRECGRVLKRGGELEIILPHYTAPMSYHIEHTMLVSSSSFDHMDSSENLIKGFRLVSKRIRLASPFRWLEGFVNRFPNFYEWRLCWLIPAIDVKFVLVRV